ncbi:MAG: flagellar hook-basal body complex protein FliE [Brevinema sp.]
MQTNSQGRITLQMNSSDPRHIQKNMPKAPTSTEQNFGDIFFKAINTVNEDQTAADKLQQAAIVSPDNVNVADIMIATEKARLSFGLLKAVTDRASRSFTDIMNIR